LGEIPIPIVEALPTTEPPKYIWCRPLRGCWARWIDKKEEESSWVKLMASPTNVGSGGRIICNNLKMVRSRMQVSINQVESRICFSISTKIDEL